jgi:hypothetical protein
MLRAGIAFIQTCQIVARGGQSDPFTAARSPDT